MNDRPVIVDFVVRSDADRKSGGDLIQARAYAAELAVLGVDVCIIPWEPGIRFRPNSIVHYFNIDRIYEFLATTDTARRGGHKLFVSTIHHSRVGLSQLRAAERSSGVRAVLARFPEGLREASVHIVRTMQSPASIGLRLKEAAQTLAKAPRSSKAIAKALSASAKTFVLTSFEEESLAVDFGFRSPRTLITPNGLPEFAISSATWAEREGILVVGRIEPRKRQLEILQAANAQGVRVTFVGAPTDTAGPYASEFSSLIEQSASVWLGAVDHESAVREMGRARVLLNFSWVEVQSLVDLEALSAGCYLVSNTNGTRQMVAERSITCHEPSDLRGALSSADRLARSATPPPPFAYPHTWRTTAALIRNSYLEAI